jgi:hypothetical protein
MPRLRVQQTVHLRICLKMCMHQAEISRAYHFTPLHYVIETLFEFDEAYGHSSV